MRAVKLGEWSLTSIIAVCLLATAVCTGYLIAEDVNDRKSVVQAGADKMSSKIADLETRVSLLEDFIDKKYDGLDLRVGRMEKSRTPNIQVEKATIYRASGVVEVHGNAQIGSAMPDPMEDRNDGVKKKK